MYDRREADPSPHTAHDNDDEADPALTTARERKKTKRRRDEEKAY
jgi:hypothetical protein